MPNPNAQISTSSYISNHIKNEKTTVYSRFRKKPQNQLFKKVESSFFFKKAVTKTTLQRLPKHSNKIKASAPIYVVRKAVEKAVVANLQINY